MNAAKISSEYAANILLNFSTAHLLNRNYRIMANPNVTDEEGFTGLSFALKTNNIEIINMLADVTTEGVDINLKLLVQSNLEIDGKLETYVQKILEGGKIQQLFEMSSFFGNPQFLDYLLNNNRSKISWNEADILKCIENVIKSDDVQACKIVQEFCLKNVSEKILGKKKTHFTRIALTRGKTAIMNIFGFDNFEGIDVLSDQFRCKTDEYLKNVNDIDFLDNCKRLSTLMNIEEKSKNDEEMIQKFHVNIKARDILGRIPKSEEFLYKDVMDKIVALVQQARTTPSFAVTRSQIDFQTLLKSLHVPIVHYEKNCHEECPQKITCTRIRDVVGLLKQILNKMSETVPIFRYVSTIVVGSLKEQTKIGDIDEADVTLTLRDSLQNQLNFDKYTQKIMVRKYYYDKVGDGAMKSLLKLPKELEPFLSEVTEDSEYYGHIDTAKYFFTFVENFFRVVDDGSLKLPQGLTLSTNFTPCKVCVNTEYVIPQNVRCKHDPNCPEHLMKLDNPSYKEKCSCRNYTSPCLSYSKIGLVLHLEFVNQDGSLLNLDVDINPPSFPVSNRRYNIYTQSTKVEEERDYDGSNTAKRAWLEKHRPVSWKNEWLKSEDMSDAASPGDKLRRAVRLRFYNNNDVIPERVIIQLVFPKYFFNYSVLESPFPQSRR